MMKTNVMAAPISAKMKMADLLTQHNQLVSLFPRMGLPLGFGEKTVKQLCEENGVSIPLFLLICHVYTQAEYVPVTEELEQCPIEEIMHYLELSHKDYLEYVFPHIENHLQEIVSDWNGKYKSLITNFFFEYKKEIVEHFNYEEEVVFPYVRHLLNPKLERVNKPKTESFDKQHDSIEDKLQDFTHLLLKYIPADVSQRERVDMLLDIYDLSDDIEKHALIECKTLIPYIHALEKNGKRD